MGAYARGTTGTDAQDTTADALANRPVVGTWQFVWDFGEGPAISYAIFHADGTFFQEGFVDGPLQFGVWEPTGERTVDMRYFDLYIWKERVAEGEGRMALTVDETGNAIDGSGVFVSHFTDDGTLEYQTDLTMTEPGRRVVAAPVVSRAPLIRETTGQATPTP
jgi:hypothetical protein